MSLWLIAGIIIISISLPLVDSNSNEEEFVKLLREKERFTPYPGGEGRGIVLVAGGPKYGPMALRCVERLRALGCSLPVQIHTLDAQEQEHESMKTLAQTPGVTIMNLNYTDIPSSERMFYGWKSKPLSILRCSFEEVLFLDADNEPLQNISFLFDLPEFHSKGALFWSDLWTVHQDMDQTRVSLFHNGPFIHIPDAWNRPILSNSLVRRLELNINSIFESGQMLINRRKCWEALSLCNKLNENNHITYKVLYGDKDTFQLAWKQTHTSFAECIYRPYLAGYLKDNVFLSSGIIQRHPETGKPLFLHRIGFSKNEKKCTHIQKAKDETITAINVVLPEFHLSYESGIVESL